MGVNARSGDFPMADENSDSAYPRIFGPYELLGRLGQGSSGAAHLARPGPRSEGLPSPVVLKTLHPRIEENDEFVRRFRHEAAIAVRVESSHVARVWDAGSVDDRLYIALEYVAGSTLGTLISGARQRGLTPLAVCAELARQLARGLADLHSALEPGGRKLDFIHRDLSPKNVMVGDDGGLRIIDLGLGKSRAQDWRTRVGRIMGSPGYMPPEQIAGETVGQAADVFAAAVVIHELFTSERYISPGDPISMLQAALRTPYKSVRGRRPEAPEGLDALLRAAMEPEPSRRLPSAQALHDGLVATFGSERPGPVLGWMQTELRSERRARSVELRRLLALPRSQAEPEQLATVLFAQRPGVRHGALEKARPMRSPPPPVDTELGSGSLAPATEARNTETGRLAAAFGAGALVGGAVMGMFLWRPPPMSAPVVVEAGTPPAETRPAGPRVEASPLVIRSSTPKEPPPNPAREGPVLPPESSARPESPPRKAPSPIRARPAARSRRPAPRASADPQRWIERLSQRANRMRRHSDPEIASGAARVVAQLSLVARVPSEATQRIRLAEIEEDLTALEAR